MPKVSPKSLLMSRTVWLAIGQLTVGVATALGSDSLDLKLAGIIAAIKSIVDILLRKSTKEEVVL